MYVWEGGVWRGVEKKPSIHCVFIAFKRRTAGWTSEASAYQQELQEGLAGQSDAAGGEGEEGRR